MKKIMLVAVAIVHFSTFAFSQNGFFLQPLAGIGAGNVKNSYNPDTKNVLVFDGGVNIGYATGRFMFCTGLGYLRTGSSVDITYTGALGNPLATSKFYTYFNHIAVPLTAAYKFKAGKKLSILPAIGAAISYNISARQTVIEYTQENKVEPMPSAQFNEYYNPLSVFGIVNVGFDYKLSPGLILTCTPTFDYMVTNMFSGPDNGQTTTQHNYTLLLNMGVKWYFARKANGASPQIR
jgi:hypothetical protein